MFTRIVKPVKFLPNFIWKLNYDFQFEGGTLQYDVGCLLDEVLSQGKQRNSMLEDGDAFSTAISSRSPIAPHNWECLNKFFQVIHPDLMTIWKDWEYFDMGIRPAQSWVNLQKRTGYTLEHAHSPCPMVISCYLKAPEGSGGLLVRDPLEMHRSGYPQECQETIWRLIEVKTNDILVFPGWLQHKTQPNNTDEDRVVLTVNYEGF